MEKIFTTNINIYLSFFLGAFKKTQSDTLVKIRYGYQFYFAISVKIVFYG